MTKRSYQKTLQDARKDLKALFRRRETLERRIAQTRQTVIALQRLIGGDRPNGVSDIADKGVGLTDAIRTVLECNTQPLEPTQIRNALETVGYDVGSSPNVLNNVHTVLRRLVDSGEAKIVGRISNSQRAKDKGYRFTTIAYWSANYAIPNGWTVYPDKRMLTERRKAAMKMIAENKAKAEGKP